MKNEIVFWKFKGGDYYTFTNYTPVSCDDIGVHLGDNAISALFAPPPMKDDVTNESRIEHGVRFFSVPFLNSRDVTLDLVITGESRSNHYQNFIKLMEILNVGHLAVTIPNVIGRAFFLQYKSSQSYAVSRSGCVSKISIKFVEYKPNKTSFTWGSNAEKNRYIEKYGELDSLFGNTIADEVSFGGGTIGGFTPK